VTRVIIPFDCGHFFKMGVREVVGLVYFLLGLRKYRLRFEDCIHVDIYIF
jgi:hypothetical protein